MLPRPDLCPLPPPTPPQGTPLEASTLRALIGGLARADALGDALPVLDAWLQQQEEELEADEATQAPLQVGGGSWAWEGCRPGTLASPRTGPCSSSHQTSLALLLQIMSLLMDSATRAENTQLVLQVRGDAVG